MTRLLAVNGRPGHPERCGGACTSVAPLSISVSTSAAPAAVRHIDVIALADAVAHRRTTVFVLLATVGWTVPASVGIVAVGLGASLSGIAGAMGLSVVATLGVAWAVRAFGLRTVARAAAHDRHIVIEALLAAERSADGVPNVREALAARGMTAALSPSRRRSTQSEDSGEALVAGGLDLVGRHDEPA